MAVKASSDPAQQAGPIGIFDSGYGGLTVFREILKVLPEYDYLYLGDNARTPYGTRSFDTVYRYTWEGVQALFARGCRLVILACNTASAKALRTIQQKDLPQLKEYRRVLGVIRPTTEVIGQYSESKTVGVLATPGTVSSQSYLIEIEKFYPELTVFQEACPMWVPLVENWEHEGPGADYFVEKHLKRLLQQAPELDTILLACTHYPLLLPKIKAWLPPHIQVLIQGTIVARSLQDYLVRHPELEVWCRKNGVQEFLTTGQVDSFNQMATLFMESLVDAQRLELF